MRQHHRTEAKVTFPFRLYAEDWKMKMSGAYLNQQSHSYSYFLAYCMRETIMRCVPV